MIKRLLLGLSLALLITMPLQQTSFAYTPFSSSECQGDASSSTLCTDTNNGSSSSTNPLTGCDKNGKGCGGGLLGTITDLIAYIGGAAAIIILITGSIRYILSGGSEDKIAGAKRSIVGALVGLAIIVLAKVIITYVIAKII